MLTEIMTVGFEPTTLVYTTTNTSFTLHLMTVMAKLKI